jgi:flagellar motor switch protein FliN/FliY
VSISDSLGGLEPPVDELVTGIRAAGAATIEALLDVSIPVVIEIGRTHMTVQEVLHMSVGSVVQLDRMVGEPVDVYVSDRKLAQGEVVVIGEHFGVRITRLLHPGAEGPA